MYRYKSMIAVVLATLFMSLPSMVSAANAKIGVVNFKHCLDESQLGKQEQARFDTLKKQMETTIEEKEKELNALAPKFTEEYLDTLTPEAERDLKEKFRNLSQELSGQQNQFYQQLNQVNFQIMQNINNAIAKAAQKVAKDRGLELIVNEEATYYFDESLDCSAEVVKAMNDNFVQDQKKSK